jgi:hypothetical protein
VQPDANDWAGFFRSSPKGYHFSALEAAWGNGGDKMVAEVLKKLKTGDSVIKLMALIREYET